MGSKPHVVGDQGHDGFTYPAQQKYAFGFAGVRFDPPPIPSNTRVYPALSSHTGNDFQLCIALTTPPHGGFGGTRGSTESMRG
jgi:hypothetical protein